MKIDELLDIEQLHRHMENGYVGVQTHDTEPLMIFNYTKKCQYDGLWDDVTRKCRGLIVHADTREIVARPWEKFHNYAEHDTDGWDPDESVLVTDKLDGSLGILYPYEDGRRYGIATRGSFSSEQAIWATNHLRSKYVGWVPISKFTYLFEIIYPGNRVVVNYGDREDLVHLGCVNILTGDTIEAAVMGWPGPRVPRFGYMTLRDALEMPPRDNAEGIVVELLDRTPEIRVKIKQEDYVALHRIISGLSERHVWERMATFSCEHLITDPKHWGSFVGIDPRVAAQTMATRKTWRESIPEEFDEWLEKTTAAIADNVAETIRSAFALADEAEKIKERKDQFLLVRDHPCGGEIMRYIHGDRDVGAGAIELKAWRVCKPESTLAVFDRSEDVS